MAPPCTLIDANNVRGTMHFPDLAAFSSAVRRWARAEAHCTSWVLLAVDHGLRPEAFLASHNVAVGFAGERTDADTLIVHAVDWLLTTSTERLRVVTSDHLLRTRCSHELPAAAGDAYGAKRPREQLQRLAFQGSADFSNCLDVARPPSPTDCFASSPERAARNEDTDADPTEPPKSRVARRRAERKAKERRVVTTSGEHTHEREHAAAELHRRVQARDAHRSTSRLGDATGDAGAMSFTKWYTMRCGPARPFGSASAAEETLGVPGIAGRHRGSSDARSIELDSLCCYTRLKPGTSRAEKGLLALYTPFGILLVLLRALLLLVAATLCLIVTATSSDSSETDARLSRVLHWLCAGLGFIVRVRGRRGSDAATRDLRAARVLAANHVSQFDGLPIRLLTPCATVLRETYTSSGAGGDRLARALTRALIAPIVTTAFAPIAVPTPQPGGGDQAASEAAAAARAQVRTAMRVHGPGSGKGSKAGSKPLLVFPEGSITNGRVGLMRFAKSAFELGQPITPVAIHMTTALPLEADTVWSPLGANVLWTLFQPWHVYELHVLPPLRAAHTAEGAAVVAGHAAASIAAELGLACTEVTTAVKAARGAQAKAMGKLRWLAQMRESDGSV